MMPRSDNTSSAISRRSGSYGIVKATRYEKWLQRDRKPSTTETCYLNIPETITANDIFELLRTYENALKALAEAHNLNEQEIQGLKDRGAQAITRIGEDTAARLHEIYLAYHNLQNVQAEKANEHREAFQQADEIFRKHEAEIRNAQQTLDNRVNELYNQTSEAFQKAEERLKKLEADKTSWEKEKEELQRHNLEGHRVLEEAKTQNNALGASLQSSATIIEELKRFLEEEREKYKKKELEHMEKMSIPRSEFTGITNELQDIKNKVESWRQNNLQMNQPENIPLPPDIKRTQRGGNTNAWNSLSTTEQEEMWKKWKMEEKRLAWGLMSTLDQQKVLPWCTSEEKLILLFNPDDLIESRNSKENHSRGRTVTDQVAVTTIQKSLLKKGKLPGGNGKGLRIRTPIVMTFRPRNLPEG
jgi:hypothetical protein